MDKVKEQLIYRNPRQKRCEKFTQVQRNASQKQMRYLFISLSIVKKNNRVMISTLTGVWSN